ncbi:MAG TPA: alpha/beta hydrolase [Labilithrix sp.]|nr:alpha/beta hydrolase [Labilithrix sp.]
MKRVVVAYGPHPSQKGELLLPASASPFPVVVVFHGGFWRAKYGLDVTHSIATDLCSQGIAVWNVEYRRVGEEGGGYPGSFHDVTAALDFLESIAAEYTLDLGRVLLTGDSAGGQIAQWLGRGSRPSSPFELPRVRPIAVVALAPVSNLQEAYDLDLGGGAVRALLGGSPQDVASHYDATSPAARLPLGVPVTIFHGDADDIVPVTMSRTFVRAARLAGDRAELIELAGDGHFVFHDPRGAAWADVRAHLLNRLRAPDHP